jgi:hypothetical protein
MICPVENASVPLLIPNLGFEIGGLSYQLGSGEAGHRLACDFVKSAMSVAEMPSGV